jgi:hypothetical protein
VSACQYLLDQIDAGQRVKLGDVRKALSVEQARLLDDELAVATWHREEARYASKELREYTKLLSVADLFYHRSGYASSSSVASRLTDKAETKYEDALTKLVELLEINPQLSEYLDRSMDWRKRGGGGMVQADSERVPRCKYHVRRVYENVLNAPFASRVSIMMSALSSAVANPELQAPAPDEPVDAVEEARRSAKLKTMMADLRR